MLSDDLDINKQGENQRSGNVTKIRKHNGQVKGVFIFALIAMLIGSLLVVDAFAQKNKQQSTAQADSAMAAESNDLSAWDILEMTSWLFWPFVLVTAGGLTLIAYRALLEYQENARASAILNTKIEVRDLRRIIMTIQKERPNRAGRLLQQMVTTFNKTNRAEPISSDVTQFVSGEREAFETFNRVLGFLSDSAGALGLLGTVWGIFETFHGGKLDGPTILMGMSISLVTTLVGLLISLGLNFGGTTIFAIFNRHVNTLLTRAEELRQALLYLETRPTKQAAGGSETAAQQPASRVQRSQASQQQAAPPQQPQAERAKQRVRKTAPAKAADQNVPVTEVTEHDLRAARQQQDLPDVFAQQPKRGNENEELW